MTTYLANFIELGSNYIRATGTLGRVLALGPVLLLRPYCGRGGGALAFAPVEVIIADTVEEPVPSVITITEIEETEVREEGEGPKTPEHPESEER